MFDEPGRRYGYAVQVHCELPVKYLLLTLYPGLDACELQNLGQCGRMHF